MIALHAIWSESGRLKLLVESSDLASAFRPSRTGPTATFANHPFVLSPAAMERELPGACVPARSLAGAIALLLPSDDLAPIHSPELVVETARARTGELRLRPWSVMVRSLAPISALDFLLALPSTPPHGVAFGSSLRFWAQAAELALELIGRQCFVPDVREESLAAGHSEGGGKSRPVQGRLPGRHGAILRGVWEPLLSDADCARVHALAQAMPPLCRAEVELPNAPEDCTRITGAKQPPADQLLASFLSAGSDAFIRRALPVDWADKPRARRTAAASTPVRQWLQSLTRAESSVVAPEPELQRFREQVRTWLEGIQPRASDTPFRLCLRLDEPEAAARGRDQWRLSFLLQAKDDPSLYVPAEQVWQARARVTHFLKRRFENPQERLLADLGRASRLYPLIDESLQTARPAACTMRTAQAYAFLRETAPLLEQSGFGVLLPAWWQKPLSRIAVRLKVKTPGDAKTGSGLLGASAIVAYQWQVAIGDTAITWDEFRRLAAMKVPLVKVRGQWVELRRDEVERAISFFERRRVEGEMALSEALQLGLGQSAPELGLPVSGIDGEGAVATLLARLTGAATIDPIVTPKRFRGELRPYQERGLSWLAFLSRLGLGACLADDMGLGKTIQLIALLLHEHTAGPTLVVCPMSVVGNWQHEIARFAPRIKVMIHHGSERLAGGKFERRALKHDVVVTTYALALRDEAHLSAVKWDRIVLDEAQNIKSPSARSTQAVKRLAARQRIALTGTPVENRLAELWSIFDFLNPGYLAGARDFRTRFALPIEKHRDPERAALLRRLTQPFVLRRLKTDRTIIRDLPEKIETRVYCHLTQEQATLYEAVVKEMMEQIEQTDGIQRRGLVLATLMKLKQICNHPAQFLQDGSAVPGRSAKLSRLEALIEEVLAEADKALIFTQFAEMGRLLHHQLQQAFDREVLFLHGGTSKKQRETMVQRFQQESGGPELFVLSIKAGGLGLNLTAANHVFHFDRWWNPAVENQATDRAFRIGQHKNVQVHKFVCVGTLEERIDQMIERKRELTELVVGTGEGWITEMNTAQLRELFALSRSAVEE